MPIRLAGAALAAALLCASSASSTQLLGPATTSVTIGGQTFVSDRPVDGDALPWTVEVFSEANQCLRLSVLSADADLEMTVVAPNGKVWRDDDGGDGNTPLIKIVGAPNKGYYSVRLYTYDGYQQASVFTFKAERLPKSFATCQPGNVALVNGP